MRTRVRYSGIRPALTCCAVAANAICAGGVYSFPLIAPALVEKLKLTQPQLTTIALAGMAGQYPFAALVGKAIDRYGPWSCSLAACILNGLGFGLFAREVARTPPDIVHPSTSSFHLLVLYFGMIGLATVCSYFALVFAATKTFPQYIGIASGTSMSIFGLSPFFLSLISSRYFTAPGKTLDVAGFFTFMTVLTGSVHLVSTLIFRANPVPRQDSTMETETGSGEGPSTDPEHSDTPSALEEAEPLLANNARKPKDPATVHVIPVQQPQDGSTLDLFKDPCFWVLALWMLIVVGSAEMVVSNLGTIILSLPSSSSNATVNVAAQVRLLSFFNTISRLLIGPLADLLAPVALYLDGVWAFSRRRHTSRVVFIVATALILAATFTWLEVGVRTQEAIWPLSVGTGIAYGSTFTVLPGILSSIWGLPNLGRNFGIISYTAFVGTTVFSYLYAFVAARHVRPGENACIGVDCWRTTFWIATGTSMLACFASLVLWRRWKDRV
ncbi:MFS general substrate transporter [Pilatotrama ljubarskyi]|nr:MFS general substrate transporter [Pilatotrama ljubarskyi]